MQLIIKKALEIQASTRHQLHLTPECLLRDSGFQERTIISMILCLTNTTTAANAFGKWNWRFSTK